MMNRKVPKKIFVIAGEASGDQLGAQFVKNYYHVDEVELQGIGDSALLGAGLEKSLFPMQDLSVMGLFEVLPKLPLLIKRINQTVEAIHKFKPDIILTIDAPDFSFRVIKKYQAKYAPKGSQGAPLYHHLVAPTVWAWRPKRAAKVMKLLDHLYCLFPFEPPYFEVEGLSASYIGHPFLPLYQDLTEKRKVWRIKEGFNNKQKIVGIFPGSRKGEICRMLPVLLETAEKVQQKHKNVCFVLLTLPHLKPLIIEALKNFDLKVKIVDDLSQKVSFIASLDAAMATSGTIGFELSLAKIPHFVAYKMNALTRFLARFIVKTPYMHLTNIHLQRPAIPEFFQEDCTVENLTNELDDILRKDSQREVFESLFKIL